MEGESNTANRNLLEMKGFVGGLFVKRLGLFAATLVDLSRCAVLHARLQYIVEYMQHLARR